MAKDDRMTQLLVSCINDVDAVLNEVVVEPSDKPGEHVILFTFTPEKFPYVDEFLNEKIVAAFRIRLFELLHQSRAFKFMRSKSLEEDGQLFTALQRRINDVFGFDRPVVLILRCVRKDQAYLFGYAILENINGDLVPVKERD